MLFGWMTTAASFFTLSAVSVDRLLSLTLHLRYSAIVTVHRVLPTIISSFDFCHNYCHTNVLDEKVEIGFIGHSHYNIFSNRRERFKNCSDRSKTSAPDTSATKECPIASEQGKRARKICFDYTFCTWLVLDFLYSILCDDYYGASNSTYNRN